MKGCPGKSVICSALIGSEWLMGTVQDVVLWELLQPMDFGMQAPLGVALDTIYADVKACTSTLATGFSSSSLLMQRIADHCFFCGSTPNSINLYYIPFWASVGLFCYKLQQIGI